MDVLALATGDYLINLLPVPFRQVLQQPGGEIADVVDAGAAVRIEAVIVAEQTLLVGIMHVDRIGVWHVDADRAERVPGPGFLPHCNAGSAGRGPVDRMW